MSQHNIAELKCAEALFPNTYTYQVWNGQQSGWPAAQLAPTLPGFEKHERQLYGMQAWPSATSSAGTIGPQEPADCNDEAGPAYSAAQFGHYGAQEEHLPDPIADSSLYHNASRQLQAAPDHQAYAYNQHTVHQEIPAYQYQLHQANGMATSWPVEQADEALLLSGGRRSAKQQLFADAMERENIDPASLYCHHQTGQQQQQQQQQQRQLVASVKHHHGRNAEVLPVLGPFENSCHRGYVCASQDVQPMMGNVSKMQPAANNGRAPGRVLGSALGQSQPEVDADNSGQVPSAQLLVQQADRPDALLELLKQHLTAHKVAVTHEERQPAYMHIQHQPGSQQTLFQDCTALLNSRQTQPEVHADQSKSEHTQTSQLMSQQSQTDTLLDLQTELGLPLQQHVSLGTQNASQLQQQVSVQTQTESPSSVVLSEETQTPLLLQQAVSTQTVDRSCLSQSTQQTQTEQQLQQPASTQTASVMQVSRSLQTAEVLQHTVSTQAFAPGQQPVLTQNDAVATAEAACQSCNDSEQASASQQRLEELQGEISGLQLKVHSLQGIVDIQEQQLQAAAGQSSDQADTPLEKQLSRWRHEVFKLLLSSKQAQHAHQQQSQAEAEVIAKLQRRVSAAENKATLLDSRLLDRHVDLDLAHVRRKRAEEQLQQSCRQVEDLQAELQQEKQYVRGLAEAVQQANSQHLTVAATLAQAEGRIAAFLHRLGYAEERLRFALQLHQPLSSNVSSAGTTGSSRPTAQESKTGGLAGTGTSLHGSQAAAVLHMEVQRLAADRAVLLHNMQVLAHQAKVDLSKAVAAVQHTEHAAQEQQVASRVAACLGEMEAKHSAELTDLGAQHAALLSSAKADRAAQLSVIENNFEQQRTVLDQALAEAHRQQQEAAGVHQAQASHLAEQTAALQHTVASLQAALESARSESQAVVLEYEQQGRLLSMQLQQHQAVLQESECRMAAMQQQHCKELQSMQQQHAEEVSAMQQETSSSQREVRKTQQLLRQLERQLGRSRKDAASASQQMQGLQAEKEGVEKQSRSMRQERNALAATLRQHGFLGRHSLSKAGPVAAQDINGPEQDVPQAVRHEQSELRGQMHEQRWGLPGERRKYGGNANQAAKAI
ncbi:hypothetical protein WJX77_008113 [Trebouxia sp. C0004]